MQTAHYAKPSRPLIAGIDTGKTAALACLDLSGNIIRTATLRFGGLEWFVEQLTQIGTPVIIATDKKNSEGTIKKLGSIYDAVLFNPHDDISVKKKNEILRNPHVTNMHERDALSAAFAAYNAYSNKLHQAEKLARESRFEDLDRIRIMVIKKYSMNEVIENRKAGRRFVR